MDLYDRIVYRALGVPDLLSPDNQQKAAATALLAETSIPLGDGNLKAAWREVAGAFVEARAELLRTNAMDGAIGKYERPGIALDGFVKEGQRRVVTGREQAHGVDLGTIPEEDALSLATTLLDLVVKWAYDNPDGLTLIQAIRSGGSMQPPPSYLP